MNSRSKKSFSQGIRQCLHTLIHPVLGFDQVKWEKKGNLSVCVLILAMFFLTSVFDQVLTGFIFNTYNPDRISVPSIFLMTMGGFALCYIANRAVSSLMFTEGEKRDIFICLCYSLVPYIFAELLYILLSNFGNLEVSVFLQTIRVAGIIWSGVLLLVGTMYVQQLSFWKAILNILMTAVGVALEIFLILLAYSLVMQIYTFLYTIFNEIRFRI